MLLSLAWRDHEHFANTFYDNCSTPGRSPVWVEVPLDDNEARALK